MRPRFLIFISILVLAILVIMFWFWPIKRGNASIQEAVNPNNSPTVRTTPVEIVSKLNLASTQNIVSQPDNLPPITNNEERRLKVIHNFNESRNTPIQFYGQVIDQNTNPLPDAKISIEIQQASLSPSPTSAVFNGNVVRLDKETGSDGRFEINGENGYALDINSIQKAGYEVEPGALHGFGSSGRSFENPAIFKMWSTNIHEQLITGEKKQIVPDGRPYFINLTDGTITESGEGDLKVWINYTNQVVRGQLYDWSAEIGVANGGLLEEPLGSAMYEAPTDGYVPSFQLQQQIKGGQRGHIGEREFYLKMKNGQEYGQMSIELHAPFNDQTPGLIRLSYALNPSGSRILR